MMKGQTKHLTGQVREALLALPDIVLMETLAQWLDSIDEHFLDWGDECRSALGYRIQSDETKKIYGSFEELEQAEPDGAGAPGWFQSPRRCALPSATSPLNSFTTA